MLHLCAAGVLGGLSDSVPLVFSGQNEALHPPHLSDPALQVVGERFQDVSHEGVLHSWGTFWSASRSGAFPPLLGSMTT